MTDAAYEDEIMLNDGLLVSSLALYGKRKLSLYEEIKQGKNLSATEIKGKQKIGPISKHAIIQNIQRKQAYQCY